MTGATVTDERPVEVGTRLPELVVATDTTFIVAAALAGRDFEPVHHDADAAHAAGMDDIFINILATNGLVVRLVTDWAGPDARVVRSAIRLGVPQYAGDTLTLRGEVSAVDGARVEIGVEGSNRLGVHVSGSVTVELP